MKPCGALTCNHIHAQETPAAEYIRCIKRAIELDEQGNYHEADAYRRQARLALQKVPAQEEPSS